MADTFRLERSTVVDASASAVYAAIVDLREWVHWSPWEGLDPNLARTYSADTVGEGASYGWKGNRKVGEGRMVITDATPDERVALDLFFERPFKAQNAVALSLVEADGKTTVTWSMTGELNLFTKILGFVGFGMDKMVGPDFEKGLRQLKAYVE